MYLRFSNLNLIHWIIKKDISLYVLFRTFQVNFQDISVTHHPGFLYVNQQNRYQIVHALLTTKLDITCQSCVYMFSHTKNR